MSGIAEVLLSLGFRVSGSDLKLGEPCRRLERKGATIFQGHAAENLPETASLLVYSSAIRDTNPEMVEARRRGIPVIRRAEVLAELMRHKFGVAVAGSHGKTTTTSMIAAVMEAGGLDPTVIIGGQVKSIESGAKHGQSDYLVAESDESDRSFLLLRPTIAVVTNIDAEHLSAYASLTDLEESFAQFISSVPFYGLAVLCCDDKKVRDLGEQYGRRKIFYGLSPDAQIRATNISQNRNVTSFDVLVHGEDGLHIDLPLPGKHLLTNSLAAIAVGLEFGISRDVISRALGSFTGVSRRVEEVGITHGVSVINDYGHHPTEIRATIAAVREGWCREGGKLHVVFQPHRYTRTRDCFVEFLSAFQEADTLIITDIYAASEEPLDGISSAILVDALGHPSKRHIGELEDVPAAIVTAVRPGDTVLCLGAGSIGSLPEKILTALSNALGK